MRKKLFAFLSASMLAGALAACGGSAQNADTTPTDNPCAQPCGGGEENPCGGGGDENPCGGGEENPCGGEENPCG